MLSYLAGTITVLLISFATLCVLSDVRRPQ
jgi:hypothetical protein